jgi:proteasome lid subunit RPN8/RPN11
MSTQTTLTVTAQVLQQIGEHAISCYPEEACGLLVGRSAISEVVEFHPCENITHSAKVYTINPKQHLVIERNAEDAGFDVVGVVHSHTHTEAYPSSTDVAQAPDPGWHYMIVTLKRGVPEPRNFRIIDGVISETEIIQHN